MLYVRRQLLQIAAAATLLCAAIAPAQSLAHDGGPGAGDRPSDPAAAAQLHDAQAEALEQLPLETRAGTCADTEEVEGLGDACRTRGGLFRVVLESGASISTHGADAPLDPQSRAAASPHLPDTQAALDGASAADIECVTAPEDKRIELVYAYPAHRPNRIGTLTDPMRQAIYEASAFVDAEARALDPDAGRRLRVLCSAGVPVVHEVQLPAYAGGGASFDDVVDGLVAQGFPTPTWNSTSPRRVMAFYDAPHDRGAAGVGQLWLDDQAGTANLNNRGARYAVEFDWSASHLPHWDVFLHEASHNMGAIADGAPDSSGGGHCNDGLDVMCYADGGATANYSGSVCSVERFDCGADSYFNPSPPVGSWLASHWNLASVNNGFIEPRMASWNDGGVPDDTAPGAPTGLAVPASTTSSLTLSWDASTDDRSLVRYRAAIDRDAGGSWLLDRTVGPVTPTTMMAASLAAGTAYRVRIVAFDQAGNASTEAVITATTQSVAPPQPPASVSLALTADAAMRASWPAGTAGSTIRGYQVEGARGTGVWQHLGDVSMQSVNLTQLEAGSTYRVRVRTVAAGGAVSAWRLSADVTTPGGTRSTENPTIAPEPPVVKVVVQGSSSAVASWTAGAGAGSWRVTLLDAAGRTVLAYSELTRTSIVLEKLRPNAAYTVQVVAFAAPGGQGSPVGGTTFRTPRDLRAPGLVRLAGAPRFIRLNARIAWIGASDNVAVGRYEIERKIGTRWKRVATARNGARSAVIRSVRPRTTTALRIRAVDTSGNAGRWKAFTIRRR